MTALPDFRHNTEISTVTLGRLSYIAPITPSGTRFLLIFRPFGRTLSCSDNPYQIWAYDLDNTLVLIPDDLIILHQIPTELVNHNDTFQYEIEIDISTISNLSTVAFRIVTIEGGTMPPDAVPNVGSIDEVTFLTE